MLVLEDIASLVKGQYGVLMSRYPGSAQALRLYKNRGGGNSHWSVAGIYAYGQPESRLVLEVLHLERFDACVVRVFQENPLTFFYGRKAVGDVAACSARIAEAAEHFQLHLPKQLLPMREHDIDGVLPGVDRALLPVPPPVNLADVPE